jgi:hypothetical protein
MSDFAGHCSRGQLEQMFAKFFPEAAPAEATEFAKACMVDGQSVSPAQVQTTFRGRRICRDLHGAGSICKSSPGTDSHSRPQNFQRPACWTVNLRVQPRYRQPIRGHRIRRGLHGEGSICESSPGTGSHSRPQNFQRPAWWRVNL